MTWSYHSYTSYVPLVELDVRPVRRRQRPRKIHLYKKAKWDAMERDLQSLLNQMKERELDLNANELWLMFKEAVIEMTEKYVPTKTCK